MNKFYVKKTGLLAMALFTLLLGGCDNNDKNKSPAFMFWCFREEVTSTKYHIPDMTTPAAAAHIENTCKGIPGYVESSYNLTDQTVTVHYQSSQVRKMNFEEAIALIGFSVNNRPAHPKTQLPKELK